MSSKKFENKIQQLKSSKDYKGILKLIWSCEDYQKSQITKALSELGDEQAIKTLSEIIGKRPTEFGRLASETVSKMDPPELVYKHVFKSYEDARKNTSSSSIDGVNLKESLKLVISKLGEKAVKSLLEKLTSKHKEVNKNLIHELLLLSITSNSMELVKTKLFFPDHQVREIISNCLQSIKWQPTTREEKVTVLIAENNWNELQKLEVDMVDSLIDSLDIEDHSTFKKKPKIIQAIGEIGSDKATDALIKSLENKSHIKATIKAMSKIGDPSFITPILDHIKSISTISLYLNQSLYVNSLENIGDLDNKELIEAQGAPDSKIRKIASKVIKQKKKAYQTL